MKVKRGLMVRLRSDTAEHASSRLVADHRLAILLGFESPRGRFARVFVRLVRGKANTGGQSRAEKCLIRPQWIHA